MSRWFHTVLLCGTAALLALPPLAEARGRFAGGARMNMGGGFHGGPGSFNVPHHLDPGFAGGGNFAGGGGLHPHPPRPEPRPEPRPVPPRPEPRPQPPHPGPAPHPGPHPHPGPGPGPHPGPPPRPGPRPLPPPPVPYWPGYWENGDDGFWWGAATGLAIGAMVSAVPDECENVNVGGTVYKHCGDTWLRPEYQGHKLVYVAVADPR